MSKSGGVFQIDDVTRTMSKGGGACECLTPPLSGNPISAPGVPPIQVQTPPPPGWLATGLPVICLLYNTMIISDIYCLLYYNIRCLLDHHYVRHEWPILFVTLGQTVVNNFYKIGSNMVRVALWYVTEERFDM